MCFFPDRGKETFPEHDQGFIRREKIMETDPEKFK